MEECIINLKKQKRALAVDLQLSGHIICKEGWGELDYPTFHRIYYIYGGKGWCELDGQRIDFEIGHLYILPVNAEYRLGHDPEHPLECTYLHIHTMPLISNGIMKLNVEESSAIHSILMVMKRLVDDNHQISTILYQTGVLIDLISCELDLEFIENAVITEAVQIIRERYSEHLSNESLAGQFGYNTNYFIRLFSENVGSTPGTYLMKYRLKKAIGYIMDGYSINDTASYVGYKDSKAFARFFKKQTGVPPSEYKKYYVLNV